jgi:hypothetical protein
MWAGMMMSGVDKTRVTTEEDYVTAIKNFFNAIEVTDYPTKTLVDKDEGGHVEGMQRGSTLLEQKVPFWTSGEDTRNGPVEQLVIDHFLNRHNTLSVRDVRDCGVPWSIEVVGNRKSDVQHIRILTEHDEEFPDSLPFEIERIDNGAKFPEVLGWGEHFGIDYLAYLNAKSGFMRLVSRRRFSDFVLDAQEQGVKLREITRRIARDPYQRNAHGVLVSIEELSRLGIIIETTDIMATVEVTN